MLLSPPPHRSRAPLPVLVALACLSTVSGCLEEPLHPGQEFFPSLSSRTLAQHCIRGASLPPGEFAEAIATTDCPVAAGTGYLEAYRARVGSDALVTFSVEADFDVRLELFRIDDLADYSGSRVPLAEDGGRGPGHGASLSHVLGPMTEYLVEVSGTDGWQRGPYLLRLWQGDVPAP